jgi:hypothetical protein
MPWYLIELTRNDIKHGKGVKLEQLAQRIWDSIDNAADFALFGKHEVGDPANPSIFYYLSPDGHKYCSEGNLIWMQPRVLHETPLRKGLKVIVGNPEALQLLD